MPANTPTAEQIRYLQALATPAEQFGTDWWANPLATWRTAHPEGTNLTEKQLLWRVKKQFTAMKSQGWVAEKHLEHRYEDDEVNTRTFEETLYRITERGKRALVEAGRSPVFTKRVAPARMRTAGATDQDDPMAYTYRGTTPHDPTEDHVNDRPRKETIVLVDEDGTQRVVTLPEGHHDQVLFALGRSTVRYRRSRRPEVDGRAVFVPTEDVRISA